MGRQDRLGLILWKSPCHLEPGRTQPSGAIRAEIDLVGGCGDHPHLPSLFLACEGLQLSQKAITKTIRVQILVPPTQELHATLSKATDASLKVHICNMGQWFTFMGLLQGLQIPDEKHLGWCLVRSGASLDAYPCYCGLFFFYTNHH